MLSFVRLEQQAGYYYMLDWTNATTGSCPTERELRLMFISLS